MIDFPAKEKLYMILANLFTLWTITDFYKHKFNCDNDKSAVKEV